MYPPIVAGQRLRKNVAAATNTHARIEESFGASFSMRSVLYERKVDDYLFPKLLVILLMLVSDVGRGVLPRRLFHVVYKMNL
jgi:hypothetical protein